MDCPPEYPVASSSTLTLPLNLPSYSPSGASPDYVAEPSEGERRLDFVARPHVTERPHGTFTKKIRKITVSLHDQEEGVDIPTYARNAIVRGQLQLDDAENILSVSVKLEGRQDVSSSEGGTSIRTIFSETHALWKRGDCAACPSKLPFYIPFPSTYKDRSGSHAVPPSFSAEFRGTSSLVCKNTYSLVAVIKKPRLGSWKQHKTVILPMRYHPRSRPFLPIAPTLHPFFSSVKAAPDEWRQVCSIMESRDKSIPSIDCHLFIPAVQIYSVSDKISVHLQLRAPPRSLRAFLNPAVPSSQPKLSLSLRSTRSSTLSAKSWSTSSASSSSAHTRSPPMLLSALPFSSPSRATNPTVRVFLMRQISTNVNGQRAWRNNVIGEGELWPLQHPSLDSEDCMHEDEQSALDWEGEVKCDEDVSIGGFVAGRIMVKDFIVIQLSPPNPKTSPLLEHQHTHPIRLVTDPYLEAYDQPSNNY
ncbi:hypothetical protein PHLCEN_2v7502 [Hermanssonia centrifuga]|uniref:LDB19 N-terminal domain-containing protein n=1 Tax=Hermanssonia centrifuga TaxID=98765 RepID=A0A2R6NW92_9APHY|nr:hypothetical protein PHLCEN_2v7502 [Hermanssonia centrifuga]